ncbi:hypothetical protein C8J56DRAFT_999559 [Mycena floridula]|nr:hypothetical protein C8J56DRAFT_999559 [Mycena floridula]
MPNPTGKNASGSPQRAPPDEILRESLLKYAKMNLNRAQRLQALKDDHNYKVGRTTLNNHERRLGIPSGVIDEVASDLREGNGPNYVKSKLKDKGLMVPRDTVRKVMHDYFPLGFEKRFPGQKKSTIPHVGLTAIGPFHEISADGHEKLGALALKMGDIGLPIYGYKDKWSDVLVKLIVVPDCRTAAAVGHIYLDFVEEVGAVPIQLTTDKGSEIGWEYAFQCAFRDLFAPDIDPEVFAAFMALKSVHNTIIEALWHWLREKSGKNLREYILIGKDKHFFDPNVQFHTPLFYWIFVPLVQASLDEFKEYWNFHCVRPQHDKDMPSGHVPTHAFENPSLYGGLDCRVCVPQAAVDEMREYLTEEVGSRKEHLSWMSAEEQKMAEMLYARIGSPPITLENAWDVFSRMWASSVV